MTTSVSELVVERPASAAPDARPPPVGLPRHLPVPSSIFRRPLILWPVATLSVMLGLAARFADSWLRVVDELVSSRLRGTTVGFVGRLSTLSSAHVTLTVSILAAAFLWRRCLALAIAVPAAVIVETVATDVLKILIGRDRPPDPLASVALASFPSGHVMRAVIVLGLLVPVAYVITRRETVFWAAVAVFTVGVPAVAYSRIYLGAHWFFDVVGSILLGSLLLLGVERLLRTTTAQALCAVADRRAAGERATHP